MKKDAKGWPKKLEKAWVAYMIDVTVGPNLMMVAARMPARAEKLNNVLVRAINDMWERNRTAPEMTLDIFIEATMRSITQLTEQFLKASLKNHLTEGMPEPPRIMMPSQMSLKQRRN